MDENTHLHQVMVVPYPTLTLRESYLHHTRMLGDGQAIHTLSTQNLRARLE